MAEEKQAQTQEQEIGKVSHFFNKISVAAIDLTGELKAGDTIHIKGATSDFTQTVDSMQIDNETVSEAAAGQSIGIKASEPVREHDVVYKVT